MSAAVERLRAVIAESEAPEQSLVVANRTEIDPIQRLLETTFAGQSVDIDEAELEAIEADTVLLVRDEEVVTTSSLDEVIDACLLVNSDLYRTGQAGIDRSPAPAVITELDETVFRLRGFPASVKEKLILILVSRFIERRALERGAGTLRATFQRLSRLVEESGTFEVYRRLAGTDLDVHVYGRGDRAEMPELAVTAHTGEHSGYRRSWCVVFRPPTGSAGHAALVALETGRNEWLGTWTYDSGKVSRIENIIVEEF